MDSKKSYLEPYHAAIDEFGNDFASTLWQSRAGQNKRFEVLCEMLGHSRITGRRLVDLGCGHGDLALALEQAGVSPSHFEGVDALAAMIDMAKTALHSVPFPVGLSIFDPLESPQKLSALKPDIIIASGTLNAMEESSAKSFVEIMLSEATEAVGFNFLSSRHGSKKTTTPLGPAKRFDPLGMLELVLDSTPNVLFRQDYLDGHDASIVAFLESNG